MSYSHLSFGRRELLKAGAFAGGGLLLTACDAGTELPSAGGWRFVDDTGNEVVTRGKPQKVLCYLNLAGALWDYGVRCAGTYRALTTPSPGDVSISGNLDRAAVPTFGDLWGELNLEQVAAAQIDLVILGVMNDSPLLAEHDVAAVLEIAPVLWLEMHAKPLNETLTRITELAVALGDRSQRAGMEAQRADYHTARKAFAAAIKAAPNLRTAFVAARPEKLVVNRPGYPTVALAREMGLRVVAPDGPGSEYSVNVSWENVSQYPADLLLLDKRPYSQQPEQLASNAMWTRLPAVRAGQVSPWNPEPVLSWSGMAREFRALTSAINSARRL